MFDFRFVWGKKELQLGVPHLPQSLTMGLPFNLLFWDKRKAIVSWHSMVETHGRGSRKQEWSEY